MQRVCDLVCGVADAVDVSLRAVDGGGGLFHRVDEFSLLDVEESFVRHGLILARVGVAVLACARASLFLAYGITCSVACPGVRAFVCGPLDCVAGVFLGIGVSPAQLLIAQLMFVDGWYV